MSVPPAHTFKHTLAFQKRDILSGPVHLILMAGR